MSKVVGGASDDADEGPSGCAHAETESDAFSRVHNTTLKLCDLGLATVATTDIRPSRVCTDVIAFDTRCEGGDAAVCIVKFDERLYLVVATHLDMIGVHTRLAEAKDEGILVRSLAPKSLTPAKGMRTVAEKEPKKLFVYFMGKLALPTLPDNVANSLGRPVSSMIGSGDLVPRRDVPPLENGETFTRNETTRKMQEFAANERLKNAAIRKQWAAGQEAQKRRAQEEETAGVNIPERPNSDVGPRVLVGGPKEVDARTLEPVDVPEGKAADAGPQAADGEREAPRAQPQEGFTYAPEPDAYFVAARSSLMTLLRALQFFHNTDVKEHSIVHMRHLFKVAALYRPFVAVVVVMRQHYRRWNKANRSPAKQLPNIAEVLMQMLRFIFTELCIKYTVKPNPFVTFLGGRAMAPHQYTVFEVVGVTNLFQSDETQCLFLLSNLMEYWNLNQREPKQFLDEFNYLIRSFSMMAEFKAFASFAVQKKFLSRFPFFRTFVGYLRSDEQWYRMFEPNLAARGSYVAGAIGADRAEAAPVDHLPLLMYSARTLKMGGANVGAIMDSSFGVHALVE